MYPPLANPVLASPTALFLVAAVFVAVIHTTAGLGIINHALTTRALARDDQARLSMLERMVSRVMLFPALASLCLGLSVWLWASVQMPQATSTFVHVFLWIGVVQSCALLVQIMAALTSQTADLSASRQRRFVTGAYAVSSACALLSIAPITSFMLTPGRWLTTFDFWDALINPTFLPTLLLSLAWATGLGSIAFIALTSLSSAHVPDENRALQSDAGHWLWALPAIAPIAPLWYMAANVLPALQRGFGQEVIIWIIIMGLILTLIPCALLLTMLFLRRAQIDLSVALASLVTAICATMVWCHLSVTLRAPFTIEDYLYSTGIGVDDCARSAREGALASSPWILPMGVDSTRIPPEKRGELIFRALGYDRLLGNRVKLLRGLGRETVRELIAQGTLGALALPAFCGRPDELDDMAAYLTARARGE